MRSLPDDERRARLARRHALHPDHRVDGPVAATRALTVLHATEQATPYLSVHARTTSTPLGDVDAALFQERSLVKHPAMRRTIFAFPRDLLPAALGSASARVAAEEGRRLVRDAERHGIADDGAVWLEAAARAVLDRLAGSPPLTARQLREELPELAGTTTTGNLDKRWGRTAPVAPRVLTMLWAEGRITRGPNAGSWRVSRPTWTLMTDWLGAPLDPTSTEEGYAELVRRWLGSFGPGTEDDLVWWLGSTKTAVRAALADVGAVRVALDGGAHGWVLPGDDEEEGPVGPWAALLPTLDATTMGWRGRDFYLDPRDVPYLFDTNGNAGNTAWWDGRIAGAWAQDPDGTVRVVLLPGGEERVPPEGREALDREAARLSAWLDGEVVTNVYASRLMRGERLP